MKMPSLKSLSITVILMIATAALVWIYKPEPKPQTVTVTKEAETRYIDRVITKPDGTKVVEKVSESVVRDKVDLKLDQPNYIVGAFVNFNKELQWNYTILAGKRVWENTYAVAGATVDGKGSPQSVQAGVLSTFKSLPFIE